MADDRIVVPEGTLLLERGAFRGRRDVHEVVLPDSLEQIDDLAFSCTSLQCVRLPAHCTRLGELALRTGPETVPGANRTYRSTLDRIEVDPANPAYCVRGSLLCRFLEEGGLESVLCPGRAEEVSLGADVVRVARTTFEGAYRIGTLRFHDALVIEGGAGIAPHAECGRVVIALNSASHEAQSVDLPMPSLKFQGSVLASTVGRDTLDVRAFCAAYDEAVLQESDRLLQAKLMAGRLAAPVFLAESSRAAFRDSVERDLRAIAVHFGARGYWKGFDDLADAGLLDSGRIAELCGLLSKRGDATASAYLLGIRRARFTGEAWDYDI